MAEGYIQSILQFIGRGDAITLYPKSFCHSRHIAGRKIHRHKMATRVNGLKGLDPSESTVVEVDQYSRYVQSRQCFQFAGGHSKAAVSKQTHDLVIGAGKMGTDYGRDRITQPAVSTGNNETRALTAQFEITGNMRGRCSGICDDDSPGGKVSVQGSYNPLGLQRNLF